MSASQTERGAPADTQPGSCLGVSWWLFLGHIPESEDDGVYLELIATSHGWVFVNFSELKAKVQLSHL